MDSLVLVIGLVSGAATIISFLIERAGIRGKWIHAAYGLFIALFASVLVATHITSSAEHKALNERIAQLTAIQVQAARLLESAPRGNDGERRGFIFASLAFLEQHKSELPDTYEMARAFAVSSGVLENKQSDGMQRLYHGWAMEDGANAMSALLEGIAGGTAK